MTNDGVNLIKVICQISREASDTGEFQLKTKSRDFRVIFHHLTLRLKYVGLQ